jgi:NADPH:quinone reductase-like Zn-dependent oxidoreductase
MKAIRLRARSGPDALVYEDTPQPQPKMGEVLIRVHATAITPVERTESRRCVSSSSEQPEY